MSKCVVVIACELTNRRCSGYGCSYKFTNRQDFFADYPEGTRYHFMTCGGCNGGNISAKLENLTKWMKRYEEDPADVVIHFASCCCLSSHHKPACPFVGYMKKICERHGFTNIVMGTYLSKKAQERREAGLYK